MASEDPQEDDLEHRQGSLYPVGRALRRTYDAENHDSLGTDLTGLMLELAHIDPEHPAAPGRGAMPPTAPDAASPAPSVAASSQSPPSAVSWWRSVVDRLLR